MNRKIRTRWCRLQHTSHTHTHTCQTNALASAAYSTPNNTFTHLSNKQTYWCGLQHTSHIKYTHTLFSAVGCSSISVGSSSRCSRQGAGALPAKASRGGSTAAMWWLSTGCATGASSVSACRLYICAQACMLVKLKYSIRVCVKRLLTVR